MKLFSDKNGKKYSIDVNVTSIKAVKAGADVDLYRIGEKGTIEALMDDTEKLVQILWCLVECDSSNAPLPTPSDFGKGFSGEALENAVIVLWEDVADFFPSRRQKILKQILTASREMTDRMWDKVQKRVSDPVLMAELEKKLELQMETELQKMETELRKTQPAETSSAA